MLPPVRQLGGRQLLAAEAGRGEVPLGAALALGRGTEEEGQLQVLVRNQERAYKGLGVTG